MHLALLSIAGKNNKKTVGKRLKKKRRTQENKVTA